MLSPDPEVQRTAVPLLITSDIDAHATGMPGRFQQATLYRDGR